MRCDRNDSDHRGSFLPLSLIGAVVPEYAAGTGRVVLSVRLEYLLAIGSGQRSELVRVKAGMVRVDFEVAERLSNLLKN